MSKKEATDTTKKRGIGKPRGSDKSGGRTEGRGNVTHEGIRNKTRLFVNMKFDDMCRVWEEIDNPKDKVNTFIQLMSFVTPKMKAIEMTSTDERTSLETKMLMLIEQTRKIEE